MWPGSYSSKSTPMHTFLVRITIAMLEHHDQRDLWRKGFSWLKLPHYSSSLKEVRTGTQTGQDPGGRS